MLGTVVHSVDYDATSLDDLIICSLAMIIGTMVGKSKRVLVCSFLPSATLRKMKLSFFVCVHQYSTTIPIHGTGQGVVVQ